MALPTFFIIGAAKAGTTSLHYYLDQHPEIQMSTNKEPNFFSGSSTHVPYPRGRVSDRAEYERLFDPAFSVRGEASVGYANYPRRTGVPERIKELVPDARFIYLVRDPVDRAVSQYRYRVAMEGERRSMQEALGDMSDPYSPYLGPSLYATQLELYFEHFDQERFLVIDQSELLRKRPAALREAFEFLSVDVSVDSSRFEEELNASQDRKVHPPIYARFADRAVAPAIVRWMPVDLRRSLRAFLERLFLPTLEITPLEPELRQQLQERFSGEAERLRAMTGKSFPTWCI